MPSPPAVVLLSGGLDSATTLAIARAQGFSCHALSFRYGQRHAAELASAQARGPAPRRRGAPRHRDRPARLRRLRPDRRPRRSRRTATTRRAPRASRSPTSRPATRSSSPTRSAAAEVLGATDIFLGVNAVDYSGYPDCRPEFVEAFERHGQRRHAAGVEGRRMTIHAPLLALTKRDIIAPGPRTRRRLRDDPELLRSGTGRRRLRPVRRLPAAARGVPAARPRPIRPGTRRDELRRQGDLLHPAGRGRPRRAAGGVLPLRRLQSLERPRGRPRRARPAPSATPSSSAPTDRAAGGSRRPPISPPPWRRPGRTAASGTPLCRLHRRRAAPAARRGGGRRRSMPRASRWPWRPTAPSPPPAASTGSA